MALRVHGANMTDLRKDPVVLVVDDHIPAVEMMSRLFIGHGYDTLKAYNGDDALILARTARPDLILLDVMMPGIGGLEVLASLRNESLTRDIPTILVTARDTPSDIEQGLSLGADDYIPKPVDARELLARAKNKIEAYRLRQTLRQRTEELEILLQASEKINTNLRLNELTPLIVLLLVDLLPCQSAAIYRFNEYGEVIDFLAQTTTGQTIRTPYPISDLLSQVSDAAAVTWENNNDVFAAGSAGMAIGLLREHEQFRALLVLTNSESYKSIHVRLFEAIARQVALAIRNAEYIRMQSEITETLERVVAERTTELMSAQELLVRSEKLASIGRLAANIAHEINNPLQPILINMEHMIEDLASERPISADEIQATLTSVRRIKRIVERLLEFTRKRSEQSPDIEPLSLARILENVVTLSERFFQRDRITIDVDLDPVPVVYGNRDHLEQVFLNLMLNAKEAMSNGGKLTIQLYLEQNEAVIVFRDTGVGMSPERLNTLFEPFSSDKENGAGLGLFISHNIIQGHNGSIEVKSELGQGTQFTIRLPAKTINSTE